MSVYVALFSFVQISHRSLSAVKSIHTRLDSAD